MKVNFKKMSSKRVIIAAMAVVIGLTGCSTETIIDDMGNNGSEMKSDVKNVTLKVGNLSPATRSEGSSIAAQEKVQFNNGWVLFVSQQENVTKVMEITTSTTTLDAHQVDISLLTQTDGVEILDVPGHSKYVYVIGNLPGGITAPAVGANMTKLKQSLISSTSQGDISNVTLFGGDEIKDENQKLVARFSLSPVVARIEIAEILTKDSGDITSFDIDGIFINNYYEHTTLDGNAPADVINNTATSDFVEGSAAYPSNFKGILFDYKKANEPTLGQGRGPGYVPETGNAWVYNLLAPKTATSSALTTPHIVIAISNIKTSSGMNYDNVWYLTITNLVYNNNKITHLEPGKVYSIKLIKFSHTNIQPEPGMKTMAVDVEVSLVEWEILDTDVIFGQN
jgi:hypothetical protein